MWNASYILLLGNLAADLMYQAQPFNISFVDHATVVELAFIQGSF